MNNNFKYYCFSFLYGLSLLNFSQTNPDNPTAGAAKAPVIFSNSGDIFGTRVFIENKGQFDKSLPTSEKVLFAYDHGGEKIYFTSKGLIHELVKVEPLTEEQREEMEETGEIIEEKTERYYVNMNWLNANPDIQIEKAEKQGHYLTYGSADLNANTFKKITYKNVYNNIDIEYCIPADKEHGIKYNVILNPGANVSDIQISYSGDVKKIKQSKNGDVVIQTPLDDITEHAPKSYDMNKNEVLTAFFIKDHVLGFNLFNRYKNEDKIIIDPWVTAVTTLTPTNSAFDVDYDYMGNTFIYGGVRMGPYQLAKYNSLGVLQWTFSGTIINPSWINWGSASNFAVDKFNSKSYTGQGVGPLGARVIRLDFTGNYDNFITAPNNQYTEIWEMGFHCLTNEVFIFGGTLRSNMSAATINSVNATLNVTTFQPTLAMVAQDIVCYAIDDLGQTFIIYAQCWGWNNCPMGNKICLINPTFNGNIWTQPSGFTTLDENGNKATYQPSVTSNGFNCLAVNGNYLYYFDGLNLAAYSKLTGVNITSITVPGMILKQQGGIAVDDCNNIYIGGNGSILTYSFNGVTFSTLTPIPLGINTATQSVYDIKLDRITKTLYVCGSGFVGTYPATRSFTCSVPLGLCMFNQTGITIVNSSITCAALGSASINASGGVGPYSYTWMPSGQTGSIGTSLSPGTYSIIVFDRGNNTTYTRSTTFWPTVPFTGVVASRTTAACGALVTASVINLTGGSGNQTYLWTSGSSTQTSSLAVGLGGGTHSVTVTDALTGCVYRDTFVITGIPALVSTLTASSPTACVGAFVTLNSFVAGGSPGYTYSWTAGPPFDFWTVSPATGGIYNYTLNVTDMDNCSISSVVTVTFVSIPVLSAPNVSICPIETATLTASGANTYTWSNNSTSTNIISSPRFTTTYTVTGEIQTCTSSAVASIIVKAAPLPTLTSNSPVCNNQDIQFNVSGGAFAYVWDGPLNFASNSPTPAVINASPLNSGVYNVTVTASNGCTASVAGHVTAHPTPTLSASGGTVCVTQTLNLSSSSFPNSSYFWSGPFGFVSQLQNPSIVNPGVKASGIYTVKVTTTEGCTNTAVANVSVTAVPIPVFTSTSPKCVGQVLNFSSGGCDSYYWSGPNSFKSSLQNPSINNVGLWANGIYTHVVTIGPCTTTKTLAVVINPLPSPVITSNAPICEGKKLTLSVDNNNISTVLWQGPLGFTDNNASTQRDSVMLNFAGIYTVTVIDINACSNSVTENISIKPRPVLSTSSATVCVSEPATISVSGALSYSWKGPSGFYSSVPSLSIAGINSVVVNVYTVTGIAFNGCSSTAMASIATMPLPNPALSIEPSRKVCVNTVLTFNGFGGKSYEWSGPKKFSHSGQTINFKMDSPDLSGTYSLMVTDLNGCKNYTSALILIDDLPYGNLAGNKLEGCVPFCSDYYFVPAAGTSSLVQSKWVINNKSYESGFIYCFEEPGEYSITGYLKDTLTTCSNTLTFWVKAFPTPVADFTFFPERIIENTEPVIFTNTSQGEQINNWTWFFAPPGKGESSYTTKTENTSYFFREAGSFAVALVIKNNWGCPDTVVKAIKVEEDFNIYVPNVFTPNGDGLNEVFLPVTRGVMQYNLKVFDRWGEMIFEGSDLRNGWDGTIREQLCASGVYIWQISATGHKGKNKELKGHVTLNR